MDAPVAGGLRERLEPGLAKHVAQLVRGRDRVVEPSARLGIEVDAQLVRVVDVPGAARPGWNTTVFICTIQTRAAGSSMTSMGCERALGKTTGTSRMNSGFPFGGFFEKNMSPSTPSP
ncbi:hypothetical protein GCM10025866_09130 [Naasia aerilata]|uniref:Uncharacterized protein n=1 Tax=Naasia aerilata TaxID=1162966 RepID=A0ABM8G9X3_9MICO|nr:hypothetical protein GCM10025866_09130 [Naasia aerilata]